MAANSPERRAVFAPPATPAASGQGDVLALDAAAATAERAIAQGNWQAAHRALSGPLQALRQAQFDLPGAGRLYELWGLCGYQGAGDMEVSVVLTRALHAYQDEHQVVGMARCHRALGEVALGRGEFVAAGREFGYASSLFARRGSASQRVQSLLGQASAALEREAQAPALQLAREALALCRQLAAAYEDEAQVRLLLAQILSLGGEHHAGARELLWAERLLAQVPPDRAVAGALARAETLLALGYPRRAASVLQAVQSGPSLLPRGQVAAARADALLGQALAGDSPERALAALARAQGAFARLKQPYPRVRCEIAQLYALHRCGEEVGTLLDALAHVRMARWPRQQQAFEQVKHALRRPEVPVRGAVRRRWVDAVGHHRGRVAVAEPGPQEASRGAAHHVGAVSAANEEGAGQGFWGQLARLWPGRPATPSARPPAHTSPGQAPAATRAVAGARPHRRG